MKIDGRDVISVGCNHCDSTNNKIIWRKDGFPYCICQECDLVYISPRLTEQEISNIYETGFKSKSENKPPPFDFSSFNSFFNEAEKYRKNNTLLDVGCFRGDLLFGAKQKGWDVFGTEISEKAARYGESNYDLNIHIGSLVDAGYVDNYFDVVSLFDVIEHLPDPKRYLKEVNRILRPGGLLYLDTPNFNSINRFLFRENWTIFFPWHLYYFTESTLNNIVENNGFISKRMICENWGPFSKYNIYSSLNENQNISKKGIISNNLVLTFRKQLKPIYRLAKNIVNIPLKVLSLSGIHIGSKLIVIAEKAS